jgi:hypothetical protein
MNPTSFFRVMLPLLLSCVPLLLWGQGEEFQYQRDISGVRTDGYHVITLSPEVLARVAEGLADLRIQQVADSGEGGAMIPYLVERQEQVRNYREIPMTLINQARKNNFSQAVLRKEENGEINRIELVLSNNNFDVMATLEGSNNRLNWLTIQEDMRLVGISNGSVVYQYAQLNFPASDYRFFRVRLSDPSLTITQASLRMWQEEAGDYQPYQLKDWTVTNDTDAKTTLLQVQLADRYPVSRLQFRVGSQRDHFRPARVRYVRQRVETEEGSRAIWRDMADLTFSSLEEPLYYVPLQFTDELEITVYNQDNLPLDLQDVQVAGPVFHLIADLKRGQTYRLLYGAPALEAPNYDLVYLKNQILEGDLVPASIGPETELISDADEQESEAATRQGAENLLLWIVMGVVIAGLGVITVRMITKRGGE